MTAQHHRCCAKTLRPECRATMIKLVLPCSCKVWVCLQMHTVKSVYPSQISLCTPFAFKASCDDRPHEALRHSVTIIVICVPASITSPFLRGMLAVSPLEMLNQTDAEPSRMLHQQVQHLETGTHLQCHTGAASWPLRGHHPVVVFLQLFQGCGQREFTLTCQQPGRVGG